MPRLLPLTALLVVPCGLLVIAGCSLLGLDSGDRNDYEDVYRYTGFDEGGTPVVTGTLRIEQLPTDVAGEPSRLRGSWVLEATSSEVGPQDGQGALAGTLEDTIEGPTFRMDLNPGMADDNVLLNGRLVEDGARLEGIWQHSGLAGVLAAGRFEAVRTREATRRHVAG